MRTGKRFRVGSGISIVVMVTALAFGLSTFGLFEANGFARTTDDELSKSASWDVPTAAMLRRAITGWMDEIGIEPSLRGPVLKELVDRVRSEPPVDRLDAILNAIRIVRPQVGDYLERVERRRKGLEIPDFSRTLEDNDESDFVKNHVRLLLGRWYAQNEMFDESLDELDRIDVADVQAPATLLFYRAMAQHQLLRKEECVGTIELLLQNESQLPRRYSKLSRLMAADILPLEKDSLDEISRLMKDIQRRQALYRSGKRVRGQEEDVIGKLDKLIEDLESQRQQAQRQDSVQSSQPMQDSRNVGGLGSGEVSGGRVLVDGDWGALPPAERAAALAEMAKDLPPHYRAVVEEYFRKLADDDQ